MFYKCMLIFCYMVVDDEVKIYKIVVVGNVDVYLNWNGYYRYLNMEVYDFVIGFWIEISSIFFRFDLGWSLVDCDGILYCMVNEVDVVNYSLGVIIYNLEDG